MTIQNREAWMKKEQEQLSIEMMLAVPALFAMLGLQKKRRMNP